MNKISNRETQKINKNDSGKTPKVSKFFSGFLITFITAYIVIFTLSCGYYGFSGLGIILLFSIYAHVALFPFAIYSIGGIIFMVMNDENYKIANKKIWKGLVIACVISLLIICLSELGHHLGFLTTKFQLNWK